MGYAMSVIEGGVTAGIRIAVILVAFELLTAVFHNPVDAALVLIELLLLAGAGGFALNLLVAGRVVDSRKEPDERTQLAAQLAILAAVNLVISITILGFSVAACLFWSWTTIALIDLGRRVRLHGWPQKIFGVT